MEFQHRHAFDGNYVHNMPHLQLLYNSVISVYNKLTEISMCVIFFEKYMNFDKIINGIIFQKYVKSSKNA